MQKSRRRIALWAGVTGVLVALSLPGAVGASARGGDGHDDGAPATETRGHDQEQAAPNQQDRVAAGAADRTHGNGMPLLRSTLAPSLPSDPALDGVAPGALPWTLRRGSALLQAGGRLRVVLDGLVIPVVHGTFPAGTARPVSTVSASLVCAPGGLAGTTASVPISEDGDATIDGTITLPATCLAPVVLVNPNGDATHYIAVTGRR